MQDQKSKTTLKGVGAPLGAGLKDGYSKRLFAAHGSVSLLTVALCFWIVWDRADYNRRGISQLRSEYKRLFISTELNETILKWSRAVSDQIAGLDNTQGLINVKIDQLIAKIEGLLKKPPVQPNAYPNLPEDRSFTEIRKSYGVVLAEYKSLKNNWSAAGVQTFRLALNRLDAQLDDYAEAGRQHVKALNKKSISVETETVTGYVFYTGLVLFVLFSVSHLIHRYTLQLLKKNRLAEQRASRLLIDNISAQEEERERIAKDLHDSVTQLILAAKIQLQNYVKREQVSSSRLKSALEILAKANREIVHIYSDIYPHMLSDLGLVEGLRWYGKNVLSSRGIGFEITLAGVSDEQLVDAGRQESRLTKKEGLYIYRVMQEVLANAVKHSQADRVSLNLDFGEHFLNIVVADNGVGFHPQGLRGDGLGLGNIQKRVEALNGNWDIFSKPGRGTTHYIQIPMATPSADRVEMT